MLSGRNLTRLKLTRNLTRSRVKGTFGEANEGFQLGIERNFSGLKHEKYFEKKHVQVALLRVEFKVAWFLWQVLNVPPETRFDATIVINCLVAVSVAEIRPDCLL